MSNTTTPPEGTQPPPTHETPSADQCAPVETAAPTIEKFDRVLVVNVRGDFFVLPTWASLSSGSCDPAPPFSSSSELPVWKLPDDVDVITKEILELSNRALDEYLLILEDKIAAAWDAYDKLDLEHRCLGHERSYRKMRMEHNAKYNPTVCW